MPSPQCPSVNHHGSEAPIPPTPPLRFRDFLWGLVSEIEHAHERDVALLRAHFQAHFEECVVYAHSRPVRQGSEVSLLARQSYESPNLTRQESVTSNISQSPAPQIPRTSAEHLFRPPSDDAESLLWRSLPSVGNRSDTFRSDFLQSQKSPKLLGIPEKNGVNGSKLAERRGVALTSVGSGPDRSICGSAKLLHSQPDVVRYSSRACDYADEEKSSEQDILMSSTPISYSLSPVRRRGSDSPTATSRASIDKRRRADASTWSDSVAHNSSWNDRGGMGSTSVADAFCQVHPEWIDMLDEGSSPRQMASTLTGQFNVHPTSSIHGHRQLTRSEQKQKISLADLHHSSFWVRMQSLNVANLISLPNSKYRLGWDLVGMVLLAYDIIMVPMQVYDDQEEPFMIVMNLLTGIFWTLDMISSFFVGFHTQGYVEMRPRMVAVHYLRGWFIIDIWLVSMDWFFLILGFNSQAKLLRFGKLWRGLRVLRLLRVAKLHVLASSVLERIQSEYKRTLIGIAKLLVFITMINHFVACLWYGLGTLEVYEKTWLDVHIGENDDIWYKYTTSLHWSLTQFTPASMEVVPTNAMERTYSVIVLLFALVTFSSFVSSITNAMTHLRNINARKFEQDAVLRRYLTEHKISGLLVNSVLHFIKERQIGKVRQVRTKEQDVEMFKILPDSVRNQLRLEAFMPTLKVHPLFYHLDEIDEDFTLRMCRTAIEESTLLVRQELFGDGSEVTHMVFVSSGCLRYMYPVGGVDEIEYVKMDEWCCEVALWSKSAHLDRPFVAHQSNCELLLLGAAEMRKICKRFHPEWYAELVAYAENFMFLLETSCEVAIASRRSNGCPSAGFLCNDPDQIRDLMFRAWRTDEEVVQDSVSSASQKNTFFGRARMSARGLFSDGLFTGLRGSVVNELQRGSRASTISKLTSSSKLTSRSSTKNSVKSKNNSVKSSS